jgi:hypothetical protein
VDAACLCFCRAADLETSLPALLKTLEARDLSQFNDLMRAYVTFRPSNPTGAGQMRTKYFCNTCMCAWDL